MSATGPGPERRWRVVVVERPVGGPVESASSGRVQGRQRRTSEIGSDPRSFAQRVPGAGARERALRPARRLGRRGESCAASRRSRWLVRAASAAAARCSSFRYLPRATARRRRPSRPDPPRLVRLGLAFRAASGGRAAGGCRSGGRRPAWARAPVPAAARRRRGVARRAPGAVPPERRRGAGAGAAAPRSGLGRRPGRAPRYDPQLCFGSTARLAPRRTGATAYVHTRGRGKPRRCSTRRARRPVR